MNLNEITEHPAVAVLVDLLEAGLLLTALASTAYLLVVGWAALSDALHDDPGGLRDSILQLPFLLAVTAGAWVALLANGLSWASAGRGLAIYLALAASAHGVRGWRHRHGASRRSAPMLTRPHLTTHGRTR